MAFSFGNTSTPAFGANAAKPTAFGAPFGAATTTTNAGFGGFGTSTFGSTQPTNTGFGSTFGAPATAAPAFGTSFGAPASSAPSFGVSFGSAGTATAPPTFGATAPAFGAPTAGGGLFAAPAAAKPSLFGAPATSTPSLFSTPASSGVSGLFGNTAGAQAAPSLFGNVAGTTTTPSLFGGGTSTATTGLFGSATPAASAAPSLFGTSFGTGGTTATTAQSLFGTTNTGSGAGTGFSLFGTSAAASSAPSLFSGFGSSGGATTSTAGFGGFGTTGTTGAFGTSGGFGGFGTKPTTSLGFGIGQQQQQQQQQVNAVSAQQHQNQQVMMSIYSINIFNDERDDILKKWNLLQACWGTGKGYFNAQQPPVEYTVYNPFYRFKAVGYNVITEHDNSEGLVKLIFNRKFSELSTQKQSLINGITGILCNKPNLKVEIQHMKAMSDTRTEVRISVTEKGATGTNRKIPSCDLAAYLNQPQHKQQLTNVGVETIASFVTPSKAALEEYLKTVPQGFDVQMWKAAVADNPNHSRYMPTPIYGFNDLKAKKLKQEYETGMHRAFQEKIESEMEELKKNHAASIARINELKQRFLQLQHRTLRILVKQESIRKNGIAIQPEEEYLKGKLETMQAHLNVPTQFKGQLNELISTIKILQNKVVPTQPRYKLLPDAQNELKEFLQLQQNGISKLVGIVKDDIRCLNIITEGVREISKN